MTVVCQVLVVSHTTAGSLTFTPIVAAIVTGALKEAEISATPTTYSNI